jgi:hypothetical protein
VHDGGAVVLILLLIGLPGFFGVRAVARHRSGKGQPQVRKGGFVSGWLAHRRKLRHERVRHENATARDHVRHRQRLIEQQKRDDRADERARRYGTGGSGSRRSGGTRGTADPDGYAFSADDSEPPRWRAVVIRIWPSGTSWNPWSDGSGRLRLPFRGPGAGGPAAASSPPDVPASPAPRPAAAGSPEASGGGPQPPPERDAGEPVNPSRPRTAPGTAPAPVQSGPRTIEGVVVTVPDTVAAAVPGVEEAIEGTRRIAAHMRAGNIRAKRRALLALVAVCRHGTAMTAAMARALSEPDQHYGPQVTEPISMGSMFLSAAASSFSDGDDALKALLYTSVDESMRAGRQLPHHDELSETGSY